MYPGPLFSIGNVHVYAYGICMAVGIILCFVFLLWAFWYKNFNEECTDKMLFLGIIATGIGILFAMLFQSLYNYIETGEFEFGSMTFIGGLIGGVGSYLLFYNLYVYVVAPRTKIKWLQNNMNASLTDAVTFIPIGITIAHAFGRLGCFFAGCCYGAPADWGIKFETTSGPVIPTQLFECIFLVILTVVMAVLYFKFKFNCNLGLYLVAYGVWRFIIEFFRADDRGGFIPGLSPSQFWSIIMVIAGIGYFFLYKYVLKDKMKHPELQPSVREKKVKETKKNARNTANDISIVTSIAIFSAFVMVVLTIVGVCINWANFSAQLGDGLVETGIESITLTQLFDSLGKLDGEIGSAFKIMVAFAILTVILTSATAVCATVCKVIKRKQFNFILFAVAMVCIIFGVVSILSSFALCNILSINAGSLASGAYTPAAGAWLTAIGGFIAGIMGLVVTVIIKE